MASSADVEQSKAWRASRRAARRFRESGGNPLYLWTAAAICLRAGIPLPAPVAAYLVRVADRLGAEVDKRVRRPGAHVMAALEIQAPGPSAFERRRRFERDRLLVGLTALFDSVARDTAIEHADRDPDSLARQARRRTKLAGICP